MESNSNRDVSDDEALMAVKSPNQATAAAMGPGGSQAAYLATDANPLGLDDPPFPVAPKPWRWIRNCLLVVLSISVLASALVMTETRNRKQLLAQAEEKRLQASVQSRISLLQAWLDAQQTASKRLSDSEVFRLFVADLAFLEDPTRLSRSLQEQWPYFHQLIGDFARQNGLLRATVIRQDGVVLLSTEGPKLAIPTILSELRSAPPGWSMLPLPIRRLDEGRSTFAIDILIPLPPVQSDHAAAETGSTFLILTSPVETFAETLLAETKVDASSEIVALLQWQDDRAHTFTFSTGGIERIENPSLGNERFKAPIEFSQFDPDGSIFATAIPLVNTPWSIYHAADAKEVLAPIKAYMIAAIGLSIIVAFAIASALLATWWRQGRDHHLQLVRLYKAQAYNNDQQRRFLQTITRSIGDWMTVSAADGRLIYANPAFAAACATSERSILGKTWQDLVDEPVDVSHAHGCLVDLIDDAAFARMVVGGEHRIVSAQTFDLKSEQEAGAGTVRVIRDHTVTAIERQRRLQSIVQTIDAFVHAVELRDAFLVGHTHRLRSHAIAIG